MDSLFSEKSWVSPPAVGSSDGPSNPSVIASSLSIHCSLLPSSSQSNFECQDISSKSKKRKVEVILDSYISDMKNNREQIREERKREQLEKEEKREQRWEINRTERKEMHKENLEIQRSLVYLLGKLVGKQDESR